VSNIGRGLWPGTLQGVSVSKTLEGVESRNRTGPEQTNREPDHRKDLPIATRWEETHLQADLTMGNLASAFTLQSEEAVLVAELRAGSEEAFSWLIERYHKPIFSLLARMVHDRADAADLTQEVFVKVFRGVGSFQGESSLRTWIYRIALREASNSRRWWSRHRQQEVAIEQEIIDRDCGAPVLLKDTLEDPSESPYEIAVHTENRERVEAALKMVPEPFRTTLILRDIEGFVYEEVAEMQGVNLGTVKSRLVRGRAHLKTALMPQVESKASVETARFEIPLGEEAR
jgi:RNA polymerase sigma-70 factor (ECF subfamily)